MKEILYLCASPSDGEAASSAGETLCRMDYYLSREGVLLRAGGGEPIPGGLLALCGPEVDGSPATEPEALADHLAAECRRREADGLLCDFEGGADSFRIRLSQRLGERCGEQDLRLYLPESFGTAVPGCRRLISSAVVGEPCAEAYRRAVLRYGAEQVALLCEPLSADYALPLSTGKTTGTRLYGDALPALMAREHATGYFSQELCARYFTYRDRERNARFVIYDDPVTLGRKISLARSCGIAEAFLCWAHRAS